MLNWKRKVLLQRALSRVPFGEQLDVLLHAVKRSPLFPEHGFEAETSDRIASVGGMIKRLSRVLPLEGATVVEVGTGWAPIPTILLHLAGVRSIHTYDIVRRARWSAWRGIVRALRRHLAACADAIGQPRERVDLRLARLEGATNQKQMLELANIDYVAPGNVLATGFPDGSIDMFFAWSVFEHIPLSVLRAFCQEAGRLLRPGSGRLCVQFDCADNFSGFDKSLHPLDYLQYSDEQWNSLVNDRNRYHFNRIREQEFLDILKEYGASVDYVENTSRPGYLEYVEAMPLAERFQHFTPAQNAIVTTAIIASMQA